MGSVYSTTCSNNNWMRNSLNIVNSNSVPSWFITSVGFYYHYQLYAGYYNVGNGTNECKSYGVNPVLYLNANITVSDTNGNGTEVNPYKLVI